MTISSSTSKVIFNGDGVTTAFPMTGIRVFAATDVVVILRKADGTEVTQVLNTHYTVSGTLPGDPTVNMVTAPATGEKLLCKRVIPMTQEADYIANDPFPAETHEQALDRAAMRDQQLDEKIGRAITLPQTTSLSNIAMPEPGAGKFIRWKEDGSGLETRDIALQGGLSITDFGKTLIDDPDAATARATLNALSKTISATKRVLGRNSAGAGDAEEVTLSQLLDWIGSAQEGDIIYRGASSWTRLAKGAANTVLGSNGTNPLWSTLDAANILEKVNFKKIQLVRKTADETVNNSTTLQNDDELLASLAANENVVFMCYIIHTSASGNADIKFAFTVPSGATINWSAPNAHVSVTLSLSNPVVTTTSGTSRSFGSDPAVFSQLLVGRVSNGATSGNLQLQWAQDTATAENTQVKAGSFLLVLRV